MKRDEIRREKNIGKTRQDKARQDKTGQDKIKFYFTLVLKQKH